MFCRGAKEFLSQAGVQYAERDVTREEGALGELRKLGYMTTPVILVDGEVVVGFDAQKLGALLNR